MPPLHWAINWLHVELSTAQAHPNLCLSGLKKQDRLCSLRPPDQRRVARNKTGKAFEYLDDLIAHDSLFHLLRWAELLVYSITSR